MLSTSFALVPAAIPRRRSALLPLPRGTTLASHVLPPLPSATPQSFVCRRVGLIWNGLAAKRKAGVRHPSPAAAIADTRIRNSTLPVRAWHPAGEACTIREIRSGQGTGRRPILERSVEVVGEIGRRRRRHVVTTTGRVSLGLSGSLFRGEGAGTSGRRKALKFLRRTIFGPNGSNAMRSTGRLQLDSRRIDFHLPRFRGAAESVPPVNQAPEVNYLDRELPCRSNSWLPEKAAWRFTRRSFLQRKLPTRISCCSSTWCWCSSSASSGWERQPCVALASPRLRSRGHRRGRHIPPLPCLRI